MTEKEPQIVKITEVKNISNRGWKIQLKNLCGSDKGLIMCTLFIFAVLLVLSKSGVDFSYLSHDSVLVFCFTCYIKGQDSICKCFITGLKHF